MRRLLLVSTAFLISPNAYAIDPARPPVRPWDMAPPRTASPSPSAPIVIPAGDTAPKRMDPVVVTASRISQPLSTVGSSMTVLYGEELERKGITQAIDALKTVPGVTFSRSGGVGAVATVRIRGAESSQVVVMVDGVIMNDTTNTSGFYDFNDLHTHNIDRIEVLRGPQSAIYGGNAVGGVINIITRRGEGKPSYTVAAGGGSNQTYSQDVGTRGKKGKLRYSLNASNYNTAGFPASVAGREDDGARLKKLSASLDVAATKNLTLGFLGGASRLNAEFDPGATTDGPAKQVKDSAYGQAEARLKTFGGKLEHVATAAHSVVAREFDEPVGFYRFSTFDGNRSSFRYQANQQLFKRDVASIGAELQKESADNTLTSGGTTSTDVNKDTTSKSVFGQYVAHPTQALTVTTSARHDASSSFNSHTTARVAAAYTIDDYATTLRASAGTAAKNPSLYQLYGPYGTATLKPETSEGMDIGVEKSWLKGRVRTQSTLFAQVYKNLIDFDNNTFTYANIARSNSRGIENSVNLAITPRIDLNANHTYTLARNSNTLDILPRRPRHTGFLGADARVTDKLNMGASVLMVTKQLDSNFSTVNTKGYATADMHADYKVLPNTRLYMRANNILDRDFQEVRNYNTAGREIFGGIRAEY
jgi:vitamin B12 transporter